MRQCISAAPENNLAVEAAEIAVRSILIELEPADPKTEKFIAEMGRDVLPEAYPPDAYQAGREIKAALLKLPETEVLEQPPRDISLYPFPALAQSGLKDYAGRTIEEGLDAIRKLTGFSLLQLSINPVKFTDNKKNGFLGKSFWAAFIRGGYQGAVYYLDNLSEEK